MIRICLRRPPAAIPMLILAASLACCSANRPASGQALPLQPLPPDTMHLSVRVRIGTQVYTATLPDQAAAQAFAALLPMTLDMTELNGNEKFAELPKKLPVSASNPGRIEAGDLMLYGAGTLVIFYRSFATPYSYTRLGRIEPAETLADALGRGDVSVTFELE